MSVLNKISNDFRIKLEETTLNKKCIISNYSYDSDKELFSFYLGYKDNIKDYLYMFAKLKTHIYYEHSKHRLEESGFNTTVFAVWPIQRVSGAHWGHYSYYHSSSVYDIDKPIFTGIRIPFEESDNFITVYQNVLLQLLKNQDREPQPNYYVYPMLSFKNINLPFFNIMLPNYSFVEDGLMYSELKKYTSNGNKKLFKLKTGPGYRMIIKYEDEDNKENDPLSPLPTVNGKEILRGNRCLICDDVKPDVVYCRCGHVALCQMCDDYEQLDYCIICGTKRCLMCEEIDGNSSDDN